MKANGWPVNRTQYGARSRVYAWRHETRSGASPTLRISRDVLETYPPFILVELLDRQRVAAAIRAKPETRLIVRLQGTTPVLTEA